MKFKLKIVIINALLLGLFLAPAAAVLADNDKTKQPENGGGGTNYLIDQFNQGEQTKEGNGPDSSTGATASPDNTSNGTTGSGTGGNGTSKGKNCGGTKTNVIGCDGADNSSKDIEKNAIFVLLKELIKWLSAMVGVVAVVMIMISGFIYATAGEKDEQVKQAKTMMTNTIIGLILYIFMTVILNFLVPGGIIGYQTPIKNDYSEVIC